MVKNFPLDKYYLEDNDGKNIKIDEDNLTFPGLKGHNYKNAYENESWVNVENEKLINWVRPSTMPIFFKFWGRINQAIKKGSYKLKVYNHLDVAMFKGEKYFVIAEIGHLGGQNYYISMSFFIGFIACIFFVSMFK